MNLDTDAKLAERCAAAPSAPIDITADGDVYALVGPMRVRGACDPRQHAGLVQFVRSKRGLDGSRIEIYRAINLEGRETLCRRIAPPAGTAWWQWWSEARESGQLPIGGGGNTTTKTPKG